MKKENTYFVVTYRDPRDGQIMTLKANRIHDSSLGLSFISLSDFIFDTNNLVVTPDQEALEKRLEGVKTLHLSIYTILSIAEVGKQHKGLKFRKNKSNLLVLPTTDRPLPTKP